MDANIVYSYVYLRCSSDRLAADNSEVGWDTGRDIGVDRCIYAQFVRPKTATRDAVKGEGAQTFLPP